VCVCVCVCVCMCMCMCMCVCERESESVRRERVVSAHAAHRKPDTHTHTHSVYLHPNWQVPKASDVCALHADRNTLPTNAHSPALPSFYPHTHTHDLASEGGNQRVSPEGRPPSP